MSIITTMTTPDKIGAAICDRVHAAKTLATAAMKSEYQAFVVCTAKMHVGVPVLRINISEPSIQQRKLLAHMTRQQSSALANLPL